MENIIAFDLGLNFGFADSDSSGHIKIKGKDRREIQFYNHILDLLIFSNKKYEKIVFEDAKFQKGHAIYNFNCQKAILTLVAQSLNVTIEGIPPTTVKRVFAKDGRADKDKIRDLASKLRGKKIKNHNESDAIAVYQAFLKLNNSN